jgi:hypothetical protein
MELHANSRLRVPALRPSSPAIRSRLIPCIRRAASVTRLSVCICRKFLTIYTPYRIGLVLHFRVETAVGNSENTCGLPRQMMPKGTDLSAHDQFALDSMADLVNNRMGRIG